MVKFNYCERLFFCQRKGVYKVVLLSEAKKNIIAALINEYDVKTAEDS